MEKFNSSLNGYNIEEVNKFVDDMTREYGAIIDKLRIKDETIRKLESEKSSLEGQINVLNSNLLSNIYNSNDEITRLAKYEARAIIDEAKKNASRIVNDALLEAEKIEVKAENLKHNMIVYKRRVRSIVKSQLDIIDDIEDIRLDD